MSLRIKEFNSSVLLELFLNGAVIGGRSLTNSEGVVHGLNGLTLIIDGDTVTFSDVDGAGYKLIDPTKSIKKEIEDATTGVTASFIEGRLVLQKTGGLTVTKSGTSNTAFGFSTASDNVGVGYAGPGGAAPLCHAIGGSIGNYIVLLEV